MIEAKIKKEYVKIAVKDTNIGTWHKKVGHISEKMLEILARKRFLPSLVGMSLKACVHYLVGNTHIVAFKSFSPFKKSQIYDLIHIDICTMQSRSIEGALYFVTFIDDCFKKNMGFLFEI